MVTSTALGAGSQIPAKRLKANTSIAPRPAGSCIVEYAALPKKTRAKKPKVRSGCISCKIRRVKCDEGKPTCQRCRKGDFKCDGYGKMAIPNHVKTAANVALGRPLLPRRNPWPATFSQQDVLYFDLFQSQLVYDLSGYSCSDFWSRIVLCESMADKCVMESVLAIGALSTAITLVSQIKDQQSLSRYPSALHPWTAEIIINDHHKAAVCHYIKALSLFRSRVKAGDRMLSPRSVLIMSMLFITFELLQGNMKAVDALITSSINLLKGRLKLYLPDTSSDHITWYNGHAKEDDMEDIEHLLPLMSIMSGYTPFLISQFANTQLWNTSGNHDLPNSTYSDIAKLQTQWSKFYTRTAAFIGHTLADRLQYPTTSLAAGGRQRALITQLGIWKTEIDLWVAKANKGDGESTRRALQIMQIQHLVLLICTQSCLDDTDLAWDAREADFYTLLTRCAMFLRDSCPSYRFTLNTSILGALGMVVIKCRVHDMRMMAAAMMRQLSWREGAWDSRLMLYGKLGGVLLEERARDSSGFISPRSRWFWTGGEWDVAGGVLVASYIRAVPDERGTPVHTTLSLGLEGYPDVCSDIGCFVDHAAECMRLHSGGSALSYKTLDSKLSPRAYGLC